MIAAGWITPSGLVAVVRRNLKLPLAVAALFMALTCIALWLSTPLYEARVSVTSRAPDANPLSKIGKLGVGLLSGFTAGSEMTDYDKFVDILMSQDAAMAIYSNPELMRGFFGDDWNPETRTWNPPTGARAGLRRFVNRVFGLPAWTQPGAEPVVDLLEGHLRIVRNDVGASHTVSMYAEDPTAASTTLRTLMSSADRVLRDRARDSNADNVAFLRKQLAAEAIVEVRTELSRQLAEALSRNSMLDSSAPYAFELLKSYRVSAGPVRPRPLLWLFVACIAGLIVGAAIAILRTSDWLRGVAQA